MNNLLKNILGDNKYIVIVLIYYFSDEQRPKTEDNTPKSR